MENLAAKVLNHYPKGCRSLLRPAIWLFEKKNKAKRRERNP
jgi:hypothetical protein